MAGMATLNLVEMGKAAAGVNIAASTPEKCFSYRVQTLKTVLPVFKFRFNKPGWAGVLLVIFAFIIYPVSGYAFGHFFPASPTFGLPCPTTIFTFGILLWFDKKIPISILIIPFVWSIIGFFAALKLGVLEDTGILIAGILMIALRNKK